MLRKTLPLLPAAAAILAVASTAPGTILSPGGSIAVSGTDALASPDAYGTIVHSQSDSFGNLAVWGGTVETTVRRNTDGDLAFDVALTEYHSLLIGLVSVEYYGFMDTVTDVDWRSDESGIMDPSWASRSSDGDMIEWSGPWSGNIYHESTRSMFALTDATDFDTTAGLVRICLEGDISFDIVVAAPSVPAPGAVALLGMAGCLAGSRRRRRG